MCDLITHTARKLLLLTDLRVLLELFMSYSYPL